MFPLFRSLVVDPRAVVPLINPTSVRPRQRYVGLTNMRTRPEHASIQCVTVIQRETERERERQRERERDTLQLQ